MKLRNTLVILFLILGLGEGLSGGLFYYFSYSATIEENFSQNLLAIAESRSEHIETYLEALKSNMVDFSSDGKIIECLVDLKENISGCDQNEFVEHLVTNKLPAVEGLTKVFVLNTAGIITASTKFEDLGLDQKEAEYFSVGREESFIKIAVSSDYPDKHIFLVSAPIYQMRGSKKTADFLGIVVGEVNLSGLEKIVKNRIGLDKTGEVLVAVQEQGERVYLFERLFEEAALINPGPAVPMREALFGNELILKNTRDYRDEPVIAATHYIDLVDLGLVAKIDRSEIIGSYQVTLLERMAIFELIILVIFLFISLFFARSISKPLESLTIDTRIIGRGNLGHRINFDSQNEIGQLAKAFNEMAAKLKDSYTDLESKIKERTHQLNQKKEESERLAIDLQKFKLAIDNVSDQIVITDVEGTVLYGNPAMEKITGYTVAESMGKKAAVLWRLPMPEDYYKKMWNTIKINKKVFIDDIQNRRKNGEIYDAKISISPILNNRGKVIFFVGIERDITKEKQIDRAKTEFVSLASHQLRTPLSAINWYAEMLTSGDAGKLNNTQKKFVEEIYKGNQRMVDLVNALLNVSRLELGTFMIEPKNCQITKIADDVIKELGSQITSKRQVFIKEYDSIIPNMLLDEKLIRIVFQNLLSNAIKYTPEKGTIKLEIKKKVKGLEISVSDTGLGIPKAQQDKIFSKLFRADNVRKTDTEGTGLGLYIVKSIVDQSGGTIKFKSEEDKGSIFVVTLPSKGMVKKKGIKPLT